jgi:uncharacterized phiE125 gp8 family phage protein
MWYPEKVTAPATDPVSIDDAKRQSNVFHDDDNALLAGFGAAARDHVEKYCNILLGTQTVEVRCDGFCDMARLPLAPLQSVTSIIYIDAAGVEQTLPTTVYELRNDELETAIVRKYGQQWPAVQMGSRITVTATAGYSALPASIKHAMLLWISEAYEQRENAAAPGWTAFDALLSNYRRGA